MLFIKYNFKFIIFFSFNSILFYISLFNKSSNANYQPKTNIESSINYDLNQIVIISEPCPICGLFSLYNKYFKCAINLIQKGFIPLIDLTLQANIFTNIDYPLTNQNPWELYFNQPFNLTLNNINKSDIKRIKCDNFYITNFGPIYDKESTRDYWSLLANRYVPIKSNIIKEAEIIKYKLFKTSENILGILMRGTDFLSIKPRRHAIPPNSSMVFEDVKIFNKKYNYDYFFITTEDDNIREAFIKQFRKKLKYYTVTKVRYDYSSKIPIVLNSDIKGTIKYMKNYLINIIILSKCLDLISARTNGAIGAFLFSSGFRNKKIYNLGRYE